MATVNPVAVQNENTHMLRGKGVEGAKPGIVQNENIHIHKGKGIEGVKAEIPKPLKRHERKALVDLSHAGRPSGSATTSNKGTTLKEKSFANKAIGLSEKPKSLKSHELKALGDLLHTGKPLGSTITSRKGTALKEKSFANKGIGLKDKSTIKEKSSTKTSSKTNRLTDEEVAQCREWAKEGIEYMPFSGNDMHKLEEQRHEERVKRKVDKAMASLRAWNDLTFGLNFPQDVPSDDEKPIHLEFEPEILPPSWIAEMSPSLDYEDVDDLFGFDDADYEPLFFDQKHELKLKDEYEDDSETC